MFILESEGRIDLGGLGSLIDMAVLILGFYALYAAFVLKREGKVVGTFLAFKGADVNRCKDIQKLKDVMFPRLCALGISMVAYSAVSLINTYLMEMAVLWLVMGAVFIIVLVWYAAAAQKCARELF